MATVLQHKVVAALPSPLEPDSIYYVRVGEGFDIHVTNGLGEVVAYSLNAQAAIENLPEWSTAETADEALTALGMSASGKAVATGTPAQGRTALGLGTAATLPVRSANGVLNYTGNGVTRAEDERAALELGPPVSSTNANMLPGRNRNIAVSGNRTVTGLTHHFGKGAFASMTIRSSSTYPRTITLDGTILNRADYDESYVVTNTDALYLEGRYIEQGFVVTFLTMIPVLP